MAEPYDIYWNGQLGPLNTNQGVGVNPFPQRRICRTCHEVVDINDATATRTRNRPIGHDADCAALAEWNRCYGTTTPPTTFVTWSSSQLLSSSAVLMSAQ